MAGNGSRTPSPTFRNRVFDPFVIGPDHNSHAQSTSIIKLEECDRVFCPLCLEKNPTNNVDKVSEELFNQYVANLFEALDQNSEKIQLRQIVIPTITIILKKRPLIIKSDHEFHNILRVIHKVMISNQFNINEFTMIVIIYSIVAESYNESNQIPFLSIWKASEHMIQYVEKEVKKSNHEISGGDSSERIPDLFSSSAIIVKTYLNIMSRFAIKKVSDLIFPLYQGDDPLKHNRVHYINSQIKCVDFMSHSILDRCWTHIVKIEEPLNDKIVKMVGDIFVALNECIKLLTRMDHKVFLDFLIKIDCLHGSHHIISKNQDAELRVKIRLFLKTYVFFYIKTYFGTDQKFEQFEKSEGIVETNSRNAIAVCKDASKYKKTIFYLLINCVAMKHQSKYFNVTKVKRVIKCSCPDFLRLRESKVMIRVYSYLIASNVPKLSIYENVECFIIKVWREMQQTSDFEGFNEEFCYDEAVLHWAFEHPDFIKMVTMKTIRYINERSIVTGRIEHNLRMLMKNKHYKPIVDSYLRDDDSVPSVMNEILKAEPEGPSTSNGNRDTHEALIHELSVIILASFHDSLLDFNNSDGSPSCARRTCRLLNTLAIMIARCPRSSLTLDDQFVADLFKFIEIIYTATSGNFDDIIIATNELMTVLIQNNNPYLMKILKKLDFTALGYMYHFLADYTRGDQVAESIAGLIIAYDNLDYPLEYNVGKNLCHMAKSVLNWTLSDNDDLHKLSLQVAAKVLIHDLGNSTRVSIASGVLHMLILNSGILEKPFYLQVLLSMTTIDEVINNPLFDRLKEAVSPDIKIAIETKVSSGDTRALSPALSFDSDESCHFAEDRNTIADILSKLGEDDPHISNAHQIPSALYVSTNIQDQHTEQIDCEAWERRAQDVAKQENLADAF